MSSDGEGMNGAASGKDATAEYISDLCRDLARMARREHMATLAYLLDMATLEAEAIVTHLGPVRTPRVTDRQTS